VTTALTAAALLARLGRSRRLLWVTLVVLVSGLLAILIWLAGRYEADQWQSRVERDVQEASADMRSGLTRNIQSLQALRMPSAAQPNMQLWQQDAQELLRNHREMLRIEWRDARWQLLSSANTPYQAGFARMGTEGPPTDIRLTCERARRQSEPLYASSYFSPRPDGLGQELLEMCLPLMQGGQFEGYVLVVYAMQGLLIEQVSAPLARGQAISFIEPDGTRLALNGNVRPTGRLFTAQHLLDLPGNTLVVRVDAWRNKPDLFPNVLTALVTFMAVALLTVLALLGRDIARRLHTERELANALAFRKAMEDSLVTGLRARDLDGRITYVNPAFCEMTGFEAGELLGKLAPMPYWPPELADEYRERQAVRLAGQGPPRDGYESVFMRRDGARFSVLVFEAPLINAQGQQTGWMSAILDVSEQRRMEELSRTSQERLQATSRLATAGEMASMLSHELNQPLAAISSYASGTLNMMQPGHALPPEDVQHALQRIAEQAERAGKVIKSVHDFVRRREQARERIAPAALLDAVMPLVQLQARKLGVRVTVKLEPDCPSVDADRVLVEQVLLNLARNGMQAMDQTPLTQRELTLWVGQADDKPGAGTHTHWVQFEVADRGAGIDEATAQRLFTPFFSTKAEGMGIGLSLARTVVEQHGGALSFEARAGSGTVFRFTLPTYVDPA
jgi:two-component system, LuxR family, sensor histidine kinase DctS